MKFKVLFLNFQETQCWIWTFLIYYIVKLSVVLCFQLITCTSKKKEILFARFRLSVCLSILFFNKDWTQLHSLGQNKSAPRQTKKTKTDYLHEIWILSHFVVAKKEKTESKKNKNVDRLAGRSINIDSEITTKMYNEGDKNRMKNDRC